MRYWMDTEFLENGPSKPLCLLSIGIVAEDGREFYGINFDCPIREANDWVRQNVLPMIDMTQAIPISQLAREVRAFVDSGEGKPEFWGYYADYDWVVFCQMFGAMIDLPKGWPMYCRDIKQLCDDLGNPTLPKQESTEHHALADARWNKVAWDFLMERR